MSRKTDKQTKTQLASISFQILEQKKVRPVSGWPTDNLPDEIVHARHKGSRGPLRMFQLRRDGDVLGGFRWLHFRLGMSRGIPVRTSGRSQGKV